MGACFKTYKINIKKKQNKEIKWLHTVCTELKAFVHTRMKCVRKLDCTSKV